MRGCTGFKLFLGKFFNDMMTAINGQSTDEELRRRIKEEHHRSPPIAHYSVTLELDARLEYVPNSIDTENDPDWAATAKDEPAWITSYEAAEWFKNLWPLAPRDRYEIRIETRAATQEDKLIYDFIMALNGLPLHTISPCKECGKWFLQITDREKMYCSPQCRARRASREAYGKIKASKSAKYKKIKSAGRKRAKKSKARKKVELDQK